MEQETSEKASVNILRMEFENLIKNKTNNKVEFLLESNNTNYISWLEGKLKQERSFSPEEVKIIANWAFGFHRRNDLSDSELEIEFHKILANTISKKIK